MVQPFQSDMRICGRSLQTVYVLKKETPRKGKATVKKNSILLYTFLVQLIHFPPTKPPLHGLARCQRDGQRPDGQDWLDVHSRLFAD